MQRSSYFIKWFPVLFLISAVQVMISYADPSIPTLVIEQVSQYLSLILIAFFILRCLSKRTVAYRSKA